MREGGPSARSYTTIAALAVIVPCPTHGRRVRFRASWPHRDRRNQPKAHTGKATCQCADWRPMVDLTCSPRCRRTTAVCALPSPRPAEVPHSRYLAVDGPNRRRNLRYSAACGLTLACPHPKTRFVTALFGRAAHDRHCVGVL